MVDVPIGGEHWFGDSAVVGLEPIRPVTLRPRLSVGYAFSNACSDAEIVPAPRGFET